MSRNPPRATRGEGASTSSPKVRARLGLPPRRAFATDASSDEKLTRRCEAILHPQVVPSRTARVDIDDAPTFRPTAAEFADPIVYLTSIEPTARKSGICKIVPPEGATPRWNADACARRRREV